MIMVDSSDEFLYNNFICSSSFEESSDDESDVVVATLVINEHIVRQWPMFRGSTPGHAPGLNHNRESCHCLLYSDYFRLNDPLFSAKLFPRRFRMARHVFNSILKCKTPWKCWLSPLIRNVLQLFRCLHTEFLVIL